MRTLRNQRGQAAIEFVLMLPLIIAIAVVLWQVVVIGYARWVAQSAAGAAARAQAVGGNPKLAAQRTVPIGFKRGIEVKEGRENQVEVKLPLPIVGRLGKFGEVKAHAHFEPQR